MVPYRNTDSSSDTESSSMSGSSDDEKVGHNKARMSKKGKSILVLSTYPWQIS